MASVMALAAPSAELGAPGVPGGVNKGPPGVETREGGVRGVMPPAEDVLGVLRVRGVMPPIDDVLGVSRKDLSEEAKLRRCINEDCIRNEIRSEDDGGQNYSFRQNGWRSSHFARYRKMRLLNSPSVACNLVGPYAVVKSSRRRARP